MHANNHWQHTNVCLWNTFSSPVTLPLLASSLCLISFSHFTISLLLPFYLSLSISCSFPLSSSTDLIRIDYYVVLFYTVTSNLRANTMRNKNAAHNKTKLKNEPGIRVTWLRERLTEMEICLAVNFIEKNKNICVCVWIYFDLFGLFYCVKFAMGQGKFSISISISPITYDNSTVFDKLPLFSFSNFRFYSLFPSLILSFTLLLILSHSFAFSFTFVPLCLYAVVTLVCKCRNTHQFYVKHYKERRRHNKMCEVFEINMGFFTFFSFSFGIARKVHVLTGSRAEIRRPCTK